MAQGCFARLNGIFMIAGSLGVAGIGWFALSNIAANLEDVEVKLPDLVKSFIQQRAWLSLWVIPTLIIGGVLASVRLPTALRWTLIILGDLWLFALFAMILYCFILSVAPLYEYQEL
jgi:hypothetical protein